MHHLDWAWAFEDVNQSPPYYENLSDQLVKAILTGQNILYGLLIHFHSKLSTRQATLPVPVLFTSNLRILPSLEIPLFKGSCGRTDLPGGNSVQLKESLRLLEKLPANTSIYAGHGDSTTLHHECETNFYMQ